MPKSSKPPEERGTLSAREPHPAAQMAYDRIRQEHPTTLAHWQETFASCAIEGNRLAEVCSETLRRVKAGEPVSDRYILGLAVKTMFLNPTARAEKSDDERMIIRMICRMIIGRFNRRIPSVGKRLGRQTEQNPTMPRAEKSNDYRTCQATANLPEVWTRR